MKKVLLALFNFIKALLGICFVFFGAVGYSLVSDAQSTGDKVFYIILPSVFVLFGLALFYSIIRKKIKKKAPRPKREEVQSQRTNESPFSNGIANRSAQTKREISLTSEEMERIEKHFRDRYEAFLKSPNNQNGKESYHALCLEYKPEIFDAPSASFIEDLLERYSYKYLDPALNHQESADDKEATAESLEKRIGIMDGIAFENFCVTLLKANGFTDVQTTAVSGDQGVDIVAMKDGIRYAVQCKCYSHPLGNTPVQEVNAGKAFYNCHVGVVMTNQSFTQGGIDLAAKTQTLLWGMDKLRELMEAVKVDVTFDHRDTEVKA